METWTSDELLLHIDNTEPIHRQEQHAYRTLIKRKLGGTYSPKLAPGLFAYVAERAAKDYATSYEGGAAWHRVFPKKERDAAARYMASRFQENYDNGEIDEMIAEAAPVAYKRAGWTGDRLRKLAKQKGSLPKKPPPLRGKNVAAARQKGKARYGKIEVGDRVKVPLEGLQWHSRSIPASMGYTREQFAWRKALSDRMDKPAKVTRVGSGTGDHQNISLEYPDGYAVLVYRAMVVPASASNGKRRAANGRRAARKTTPKKKAKRSQRSVLAAALRKDRRRR